jgi:hypothetical protein
MPLFMNSAIGAAFAANGSSLFQVKPTPFNTNCNPGLASTPFNVILVAMSDGSGRSVAPSVSANTWWLVANPSDGQTPASDWN